MEVRRAETEPRFSGGEFNRSSSCDCFTGCLTARTCSSAAKDLSRVPESTAGDSSGRSGQAVIELLAVACVAAGAVLGVLMFRDRPAIQPRAARVSTNEPIYRFHGLDGEPESLVLRRNGRLEFGDLDDPRSFTKVDYQGHVTSAFRLKKDSAWFLGLDPTNGLELVECGRRPGDAGSPLTIQRRMCLDETQERVDVCAIDPQGERLAISDGISNVVVWSLNPLERLCEIRMGRVDSVEFTSDSSNILTLESAEAVKVWDSMTGRLVKTIPIPGESSRSLVHSAQSHAVIYGRLDNQALLTARDMQTGQVVWSVPSQTDVSNCVALHEASGLVAAGGTDGIVRLIDASRGEILLELQSAPDTIAFMSFSSAGDTLRVADYAGRSVSHDLSALIAYRQSASHDH